MEDRANRVAAAVALDGDGVSELAYSAAGDGRVRIWLGVLGLELFLI
jgi:hypothetical protein